MRKTLGLWSKGLALFLAAVLGAQGVFAYQPENNFWAERRRATQRSSSLLLASLPLSPPGTDRPSPGQPFLSMQGMTPTLPPSLSRSIPKSFFNDHATVLAALSSGYGTVRKVSFPKTKTGPLVIQIQDVHRNAQAQWNIRETVRSLLETGQVTLMALEGATNDIDLQPFVNFPHRKAVEMAADYLLKENKISGPIHAVLTAQGQLPRLLGIDDPAHYEANVQAYRDSAPKQEKTQGQLKALQSQLEERKRAIYSPALQALDQQVQTYRAGKSSLGDYVYFLANARGSGKFLISPLSPTVRRFIDALELERTLDFKQVESERVRLIERLTETLTPAETQNLVAQSLAYRSGRLRYAEFYADLRTMCAGKGIPLTQYPTLDAYVRYVLLADGIDVDQLLREIAALEENAYAREAKMPEERVLVARSRQAWLTSKLVDFSLTPEEWKEYASGEAVDPTIDLSSFEGFYKEAQSRDTAMAANLLSGVKIPRGEKKEFLLPSVGEGSSLPVAGVLDGPNRPRPRRGPKRRMRGGLLSKQSPLPPPLPAVPTRHFLLAQSPAGEGTRLREPQTDPVPSVAILITGGFHADGMTGKLTLAGATVISYVPKIEKVDTAEGSKYLSVFTQEKTPLEKLFQGEKLFLAVNPAPMFVRRTLLPSLVAMATIALLGISANIDVSAIYQALGGIGVLTIIKATTDFFVSRIKIQESQVELTVSVARGKILDIAETPLTPLQVYQRALNILKSSFSLDEPIRPLQTKKGNLIFSKVGQATGWIGVGLAWVGAQVAWESVLRGGEKSLFVKKFVQDHAAQAENWVNVLVSVVLGVGAFWVFGVPLDGLIQIQLIGQHPWLSASTVFSWPVLYLVSHFGATHLKKYFEIDTDFVKARQMLGFYLVPLSVAIVLGGLLGAFTPSWLIGVVPLFIAIPVMFLFPWVSARHRDINNGIPRPLFGSLNQIVPDYVAWKNNLLTIVVRPSQRRESSGMGSPTISSNRIENIFQQIIDHASGTRVVIDKDGPIPAFSELMRDITPYEREHVRGAIIDHVEEFVRAAQILFPKGRPLEMAKETFVFDPGSFVKLILLAEPHADLIAKHFLNSTNPSLSNFLRFMHVRLVIDALLVASLRAASGLKQIGGLAPQDMVIGYHSDGSLLMVEVTREMIVESFPGYSLTRDLGFSPGRLPIQFNDWEHFGISEWSSFWVPFYVKSFHRTHSHSEKIDLSLGKRKVIVVGSLGGQHFGLLKKVLENWPGEDRPLIVIAPRMENDSWARELRASGFKVSERNSRKDLLKDQVEGKDILILNTHGELDLFYGAADVAVVDEGHNLSEPVRQGVPTLSFGGGNRMDDLLRKRGIVERVDESILFEQLNGMLVLTDTERAGKVEQGKKILDELLTSVTLLFGLAIAGAVARLQGIKENLSDSTPQRRVHLTDRCKSQLADQFLMEGAINADNGPMSELFRVIQSELDKAISQPEFKGGDLRLTIDSPGMIGTASLVAITQEDITQGKIFRYTMNQDTPNTFTVNLIQGNLSETNRMVIDAEDVRIRMLLEEAEMEEPSALDLKKLEKIFYDSDTDVRVRSREELGSNLMRDNLSKYRPLIDIYLQSESTLFNEIVYGVRDVHIGTSPDYQPPHRYVLGSPNRKAAEDYWRQHAFVVEKFPRGASRLKPGRAIAIGKDALGTMRIKEAQVVAYEDDTFNSGVRVPQSTPFHSEVASALPGSPPGTSPPIVQNVLAGIIKKEILPDGAFILPDTIEKRTSEENTNESVRFLVVNEEGEILVLENQKGAWETPGGGVDKIQGEDRFEIPLEAIQRELIEETGIKVAKDQVELLGDGPVVAYTYVNVSGFSEKRLVHVAIVRVKGSPKVTIVKEHKSFKWVSMEDMFGNLSEYTLGTREALLVTVLTKKFGINDIKSLERLSSGERGGPAMLLVKTGTGSYILRPALETETSVTDLPQGSRLISIAGQRLIFDPEIPPSVSGGPQQPTHGGLIPLLEPLLRWLGSTVLRVPKRYQDIVYRLGTAPAFEEALVFLLGLSFDLMFPGFGVWNYRVARGLFFGAHFFPGKGLELSWGRIISAGVISVFHGVLLWQGALAPGLIAIAVWVFHVGVNQIGRSEEARMRRAGAWVAETLLGRDVGPAPVVGKNFIGFLYPAEGPRGVNALDRPITRGDPSPGDIFFQELGDRLSAAGVRLEQVELGRMLNALSALTTGRSVQLDDPVAHLMFVGPSGISEAVSSATLLKELNQGSKNPVGLFMSAATPETARALAPMAGPDVFVLDASGAGGRVDVGKMAPFEAWAKTRARGDERLSLTVSRSLGVELTGFPRDRKGWVAKALDILALVPLTSREMLNFLRATAHLRRMA